MRLLKLANRAIGELEELSILIPYLPTLRGSIIDMEAINLGFMTLSSTRASFVLPLICFVEQLDKLGVGELDFLESFDLSDPEILKKNYHRINSI